MCQERRARGDLQETASEDREDSPGHQVTRCIFNALDPCDHSVCGTRPPSSCAQFAGVALWQLLLFFGFTIEMTLEDHRHSPRPFIPWFTVRLVFTEDFQTMCTCKKLHHEGKEFTSEKITAHRVLTTCSRSAARVTERVLDTVVFWPIRPCVILFFFHHYKILFLFQGNYYDKIRNIDRGDIFSQHWRVCVCVFLNEVRNSTRRRKSTLMTGVRRCVCVCVCTSGLMYNGLSLVPSLTTHGLT